jgi:hypothetical protein
MIVKKKKLSLLALSLFAITTGCGKSNENKPNMMQKVGPLLNKILAHSSRGKMLLAGGALTGLLGKKMLDTSAFNESAFE